MHNVSRSMEMAGGMEFLFQAIFRLCAAFLDHLCLIYEMTKEKS